MAETGPAIIGLTAENVQAWLVGRVARYLDEPAETVDPDAPLAGYGLDSVYAFRLCGEIENDLGVLVEPAVMWDVENLVDLADHIAGLAARQSGGDRSAAAAGQPVDPGRPRPAESEA
jgi:acyl carrier protein